MSKELMQEALDAIERPSGWGLYATTVHHVSTEPGMEYDFWAWRVTAECGWADREALFAYVEAHEGDAVQAELSLVVGHMATVALRRLTEIIDQKIGEQS